MKVLAFELSTARGSVAWKDQDRLIEKEWPNDRKNSGPFFENLKAITDAHGLPDLIIVGLGPGSYAGIRIAISTAIGLQAACGASLVGAPSICAMECEARSYYAIGDARRNSFFLARIDDRCLVGDPELFSEAELKLKLESGEAAPVISSDHLPQFRMVRSSFPSAARLAQFPQDRNRNFASPPLQPMYLREPHITLPRKAADRAVTS